MLGQEVKKKKISVLEERVEFEAVSVARIRL
jgi:hypothetical protein